MISVFTATYNRANELKNLYESLKKQAYKDFEWVIIDDGSVDNTKEIVEQFISENNIKIIYKYKENGGKMSAHNYGLDYVNGDIFVNIDSDDCAVENLLENINKCYKKIKDNNEICGIAFLDINKKTKEIIGTKFPEDELIDTYYNIYNKHKLTGDKTFIFKTEILKENRFPKFENEKFVPEACLYNRLSRKYKIMCYNIPAIEVEYLENGYSSNYFKLAKNNPKGQVLYYKELYELEPSLYNVAAYDMYSIFAKNSMIKTIKEHPSKLKALLMYLPALYKAKTK